MNSDVKLIVGVVVGSVVLLVAAVVGLGKLGGNQGTSGGGQVKVVQGEERLIKEKGETKVTVVEFSDLQCPACRAVQPLVRQVADKEGVKLVFRHMPLSQIHKNAQKAAEAAEAANAQGKFWEFHDVLYERQDEWSELGGDEALAKFGEYAEGVGLDKEKLINEVKEGVYKDKVLADYQEGVRLGVRGTPTFFVNGRQVETAQLTQVVEEELQK